MTEPQTFIEYKPTHPAFPFLIPWLDRHEQAYQRQETDLEAEYQIEAYLELIRQDYLAYLRSHIGLSTPTTPSALS